MLSGFEVNTDIEFIDPDWEDFAEVHDRRYGLAISYVKSVVKGNAFDNQAMNLRFSERGFWTQSRNFPASFYGDTGDAASSFVSEADAQAAVFDAVALYRAGDARSITSVYSEKSPTDVFFGYRFSGSERYELGLIRPGLPMHLRVMVDALEPCDLLGDAKGVLIYQRTSDGRHMLIRAPGRRQPFPLLDGFSE